MNCHQCGGRLTGDLSICPFCGVRSQIDLRQVHFRRIRTSSSLYCPSCEDLKLSIVKIDSDPAVNLDHCERCHGLFFNPGELLSVLSSETHPSVWLDPERIESIAKLYDQRDEVFYRRCPHCKEHMNRQNFGGKSGAIVDQCAVHGVWLDSGELYRLLQWWHAGGKHIHQSDAARQLKWASDADRKRRLSALPGDYRTVGGDSPLAPENENSGVLAVLAGLLAIVAEILS